MPDFLKGGTSCSLTKKIWNYLRNGYLKAYGNMDPVTQYRLDAYPLFAEMVVRVKKEFMKEILKE